MFDAQAAQILATTDQIAERVRKTGNTTLRSVGDIGRHQSLKDNDKDFVKPDDMLVRSEEHTSELQSLMRISYAVFCLKKKKNHHTNPNHTDKTTNNTQN